MLTYILHPAARQAYIPKPLNPYPPTTLNREPSYALLLVVPTALRFCVIGMFNALPSELLRGLGV